MSNVGNVQKQIKINKPKEIQYAIEVTDCFVADKINAFNPLLVKVQLIGTILRFTIKPIRFI